MVCGASVVTVVNVVVGGSVVVVRKPKTLLNGSYSASFGQFC